MLDSRRPAVTFSFTYRFPGRPSRVPVDRLLRAEGSRPTKVSERIQGGIVNSISMRDKASRALHHVTFSSSHAAPVPRRR